jgi:hypothetical protein
MYALNAQLFGEHYSDIGVIYLKFKRSVQNQVY